jgi:DNA helicase-2/ATP-dependent DNA helicase PcrA
MDKENAIFEGLNAEQREAVSSIQGPVLIVAGAGSGKTRVLTSRIALILARGEDPSRVMALTFTKKAANEMKERIALMVGKRNAWRLFMGTFHSIFIRFLREYASFLGYPANFTIYDTSDSISAIKACLKALGLDDKVYKPRDVLSRISLAKNNLFTAASYSANAKALEEDRRSRKPDLWKVFNMYSEKCKLSGVMDFDDILLNMNILLRHNPEAKESISSRFDYILVDEYQDTNFAQYLILKQLSEKHRNICVVGDDSQSIYAFRGAKIENILNFRKDYPDCRIFRLEKNYRSTANIVNAANSLIAKNENRIPKTCVSVGAEGDKISILNNFSEQEEALGIASEIVSTMESEHAAYQDFAILYRTNSQSRALEEALRRRNLPYMIYSGNSFYDRAEVKDMMAYFKLVVNVHDNESFKRAVNMPARGIGETSITNLENMSRALGVSMFKAAYSENFSEYGLKAPAVARIRSFCEMINKYAAVEGKTNADEVAAGLSKDSGLYAFYKSDQSVESQSRAGNIEELLNSVTQFMEERQNEYLEELSADGDSVDPDSVQYPVVTLGEYLENVSLLTGVDASDEEDSRNKIALMTVHSAKGLEFPYVFVAGLEENLFPSGGMLASPKDIEEERRLFYVAITRAKKKVWLSFAQTRMRNGRHEANSPSRFIGEIDSQYISNPLSEDDYSESEDDDLQKFRGFGSWGGFGRSSYSGGYGKPYGGRTSSGGYGQSGRAQYIHSSKPKPSSSAASGTFIRKAPLPPKTDDPSFTALSPEELMSRIRVEQEIVHNRFGKGKVLELSGGYPDMKAKISFEKYGDKILLLKYAKMKILS